MREEKKNVATEKNENISAFEPQIIGIGILLAVLSAIICMQIIGKVGVTPNTSLIARFSPCCSQEYLWRP